MLGLPINTGQNIFIDGFPAELPLFHLYRQKVLEELRVDVGLEDSAIHFLSQVAKDRGAEIFVGIHVRRTDYAGFLKRKYNGRLLSKRVDLKFQTILV